MPIGALPSILAVLDWLPLHAGILAEIQCWLTYLIAKEAQDEVEDPLKKAELLLLSLDYFGKRAYLELWAYACRYGFMYSPTSSSRI